MLLGRSAEFQTGSRGRVLRNRLGITSVRELERRESAALLIATQQIIDETRVDQRFTAGEIRRMHQTWLGEIYESAGEYRGVNIAKGAFMFAAARPSTEIDAGLRARAAPGIYAMQLRYNHCAGNRLGDRAY